jgi:hypothetical protein
MDAMLDNTGHAWLLEVNARPSLAGKEADLKTKVIEAALELILSGEHDSRKLLMAQRRARISTLVAL